MDVSFNKDVIIEVIGHLKGRANSWGNRGNQSTNEVKSVISKEIEFELNDFADMLINASNHPEYVGSNKAYWDSVGKT